MEWIGIGIALVVAAWVYSDAKERGCASPGGWAFGVFALLIIFLPMYFFMRPAKKSATVKLCPFCGRYYEGIPTFCSHCGKNLTEANQI